MTRKRSRGNSAPRCSIHKASYQAWYPAMIRFEGMTYLCASSFFSVERLVASTRKDKIDGKKIRVTRWTSRDA